MALAIPSSGNPQSNHQRNKKMRVGIICHEYPPDVIGGIPVQTYEIAHSLSRKGIDVELFCGKARKPTVVRENEHLTIHRLPFIELKPRSLWFQLRNYSYIRKHLKDVDIVHSHTNGYTINSIGGKKPWVVSVHGPMPDFRQAISSIKSLNIYEAVGALLGWMLFRIDLKSANKMIACGKFAEQEIIKHFGNEGKIICIQNGINLDEIGKIKEQCKRQEKDNGKTIFFSGRFYPVKGIEYLLKAMPKVIEEHPDVKLKIFGKGPLENEIRDFIKKQNLERSIELVGFVDHDFLMSELRISDVVVFPSLLEGLSIAMLEAMAFEKPIVAFDYPFTREIMENGKTGILVKPMDVDELAKGISYLLSNPDERQRIGRNAYNYVKTNHDWDVLTDRYIDVYKSLL